MRYFQIHPEVSCCSYKHGVLHDKEAIYPETQWENGEALEKVKRGFLVEVEAPKEQEVKVEETVPDTVKEVSSERLGLGEIDHETNGEQTQDFKKHKSKK